MEGAGETELRSCHKICCSRRGRKNQHIFHLVNGKVVTDRKVVFSFFPFYRSDGTMLARNALEKKIVDPPMNKHAASTVEAFLYEGIAAGEVFDDVFIFHVVHFHDMMFEIGEKIVVQG